MAAPQYNTGFNDAESVNNSSQSTFIYKDLSLFFNRNPVTSDVATVTDADTISLVANKAVHGDYVHVWSDGTNWYLDGMCKVQDGITTTQAG